jgi:hypothetical protein
MRDDVGKNWTLRLSGRPYQTDMCDVNVPPELPGRVVRPPTFESAYENVAS